MNPTTTNSSRTMQLVFATSNLGKLKEIQGLMPEHIKLLSLSDIGCSEDIPETQNSIEGNAVEKANYIKKHYGYDCFADDTGLEVYALGGAPGVFSARYAGEQRSATDNINKLLDNLTLKKDRNAQFKTVIALSRNKTMQTFTGICKGTITKTKRGSQGFGYDPIFKPNGYENTFAEMTTKLKNSIGHRGKAIRQLIHFLNV